MVRKRDTKQIDSIAGKVGLSREQRTRLHLEITKQDLTYQEILEKAWEIKAMYPSRWSRKRNG